MKKMTQLFVLFQNLNAEVKIVSPHAELLEFGSYAMGIGSRNSDIDLCLSHVINIYGTMHNFCYFFFNISY